MPAPILLRPPEPADQREFLAAAKRSRQLHHPWVTVPTTAAEFRAYLAHVAAPGGCAFLVCEKSGGEIAGVVNVTNIVRGPFRSAYLGYYTFTGHERRGLMRAGLRAVVRHAFTKLKLHRLEANIQPDNVASIELVKSCGFAKEGYSPRYLKVRGRWRDHERWAIIAD